jgi:hypothetical protein
MIQNIIPDQNLDFLPIPYPGSTGQKATGSRIRIRPVSGSAKLPLILTCLQNEVGNDDDWPSKNVSKD